MWLFLFPLLSILLTILLQFAYHWYFCLWRFLIVAIILLLLKATTAIVWARIVHNLSPKPWIVKNGHLGSESQLRAAATCNSDQAFTGLLSCWVHKPQKVYTFSFIEGNIIPRSVKCIHSATKACWLCLCCWTPFSKLQGGVQGLRVSHFWGTTIMPHAYCNKYWKYWDEAMKRYFCPC